MRSCTVSQNKAGSAESAFCPACIIFYDAFPVIHASVFYPYMVLHMECRVNHIWNTGSEEQSYGSRLQRLGTACVFRASIFCGKSDSCKKHSEAWNRGCEKLPVLPSCLLERLYFRHRSSRSDVRTEPFHSPCSVIFCHAADSGQFPGMTSHILMLQDLLCK